MERLGRWLVLDMNVCKESLEAESSSASSESSVRWVGSWSSYGRCISAAENLSDAGSGKRSRGYSDPGLIGRLHSQLTLSLS